MIQGTLIAPSHRSQRDRLTSPSLCQSNSFLIFPTQKLCIFSLSCYWMNSCLQMIALLLHWAHHWFFVVTCLQRSLCKGTLHFLLLLIVNLIIFIAAPYAPTSFEVIFVYSTFHNLSNHNSSVPAFFNRDLDWIWSESIVIMLIVPVVMVWLLEELGMHWREADVVGGGCIVWIGCCVIIVIVIVVVVICMFLSSLSCVWIVSTCLHDPKGTFPKCLDVPTSRGVCRREAAVAAVVVVVLVGEYCADCCYCVFGCIWISCCCVLLPSLLSFSSCCAFELWAGACVVF